MDDNTFLTFNDVLLMPQYSEIASRDEVDISSSIGEGNRKRELRTPLISAPMDTVTDGNFAATMKMRGGIGIIHRYMSIEDQVNEVYVACNLSGGKGNIGAAIGATSDYLDRFDQLVRAGADVICIDVAHGHHLAVRKALENLSTHPLRDRVHIIAGNIASAAAYRDLSDWGADSLRVGVGGGCFTPKMKVITNQGTKDISDIIIGDTVLSSTGRYELVTDKLSFFVDEDLYNIDGVECTGNHEFLAVLKKDARKASAHESWISAEHLDKGKHFLVKSNGLQEIHVISKFRYRGLVHDLTVDKVHNYNIDGVIVHNSVCSTRINTGHGAPNIGVLQHIDAERRQNGGASIILDGGIKTSGDIVKALAFGADAVMCGGMFSGHKETPGKIVHDTKIGWILEKLLGEFSQGKLASIRDNSRRKEFRGMASKSAQVAWRGKKPAADEGVSTFVKYKGSVHGLISEIQGHIRSGFSYSGATNIKEFYDKAEYLVQTYAGQIESSPHIHR